MIGIYFEKILVATISTENDRPQLVYNKDWIGRSGSFPISLSIPLSSAPVGAETIIPWLANLLPESHLSQIGQQFGVSPQDVIGLLLRIGRDTAGALSIGHPREGHDEYRAVENDAELERIINELPQKPFLVGDEGVSMSLAGVQDKLPVSVCDGKITIPLNGMPSTHILKPDVPRLAQVYPHVTRQLPQTISGKREAIHLFGKDWQHFARSVSLSSAQTLKRIAELATMVLDHIDAATAAVRAMPAGDDPVLDKIAFQVRKRARLIARQLDQLDHAVT